MALIEYEYLPSRTKSTRTYYVPPKSATILEREALMRDPFPDDTIGATPGAGGAGQEVLDPKVPATVPDQPPVKPSIIPSYTKTATMLSLALLNTIKARGTRTRMIEGGANVNVPRLQNTVPFYGANAIPTMTPFMQRNPFFNITPFMFR